MTEIILTLGQAFEIAYQMVLESSDNLNKQLTIDNNIKNNINTNKSRSNQRNGTDRDHRESVKSIRFDNPQTINDNNNTNNTFAAKQNNTYITTINISATDQPNTNTKSKPIADQKPTNRVTRNGKLANLFNKHAKNSSWLCAPLIKY